MTDNELGSQRAVRMRFAPLSGDLVGYASFSAQLCQYGRQENDSLACWDIDHCRMSQESVQRT
jgi:hypothetical protein